MIHAIRAYQPVSIPGRTSMNMISRKQVPELESIQKTDGGFIIKGSWMSKWDNKNVSFDVFIPDSNIQFAYILNEEPKKTILKMVEDKEKKPVEKKVEEKKPEEKKLNGKIDYSPVPYRDLFRMCEQRGIETPKRPSKLKIINLLHEHDAQLDLLRE